MRSSHHIMKIMVLALLACGIACVETIPYPEDPARFGELPLIEGSDYVGVIFTRERMLKRERIAHGSSVADVPPGRYWSPSPQDVATAEADLKPALERAIEHPFSYLSPVERNDNKDYVNQALSWILKNLSTYRRQYFGVVDSNESAVLVINCIYHPGNETPREDWRKDLVVPHAMVDAAYYIWRIQYDIESGNFSQLEFGN